MMTKIEIERVVDERLAEMRKQMIEELQGQVESNNNPKTIWDLDIRDCEEYYRLFSDGEIVSIPFSVFVDENARAIGNAFLTKEEAEFEVERRKIETIMRKYSSPFDEAGKSWSIDYSYYRNFITAQVNVYNSGIPYFESEKMARKVIDEIGEDRLKKYWFGVEDDE